MIPSTAKGVKRMPKIDYAGVPRTGEALPKKNRRAVAARLARYYMMYKWRVAAAFALMLGSNLFALLGPWLSGKAIDAIDSPAGVDFAAVGFYCLLMAVFYVVSAGLSYLLSVLMVKLSQRIVKTMRQDVFDKILALPVGDIDRVAAGDLINRISYDISTVNASLSNDVLQAATGIVTVIGALVGMIAVSPPLLGVFAVTIPISLLITVLRGKTMRPLFRKRSAKLAELNGFSEEMLSGLNAIRAYGREEEITAKFRVKNTEAADAYYRADYIASLIGPSVNFVNNFGTVLISAAGAFFYLYGKIGLGAISSFLLYARRFSGPVNEFANIIGEIQSALAAAERVFRLLDRPSEAADAPGAKVLSDVKGKVEFKNVRFGYEEGEDVIGDLSFTAEPGQTVAIVGPTGAGKTTLVNLMMRFYDPRGGSILLDGEDIRGYTRKSLRAAFTMVLQDTWLFEGTVFENIAYGKEGATRGEVKRASEEAHIADFIEGLPDGYDTVLTDGGSLSKGQKQLLTIARAMLSPAKLLILDEATSNVDTRTELLIRDAMARLMKGRTCFVIAHRLTTVRSADLILVVKGGDIVERGRHEELLQREGFYSEIYEAQFE